MNKERNPIPSIPPSENVSRNMLWGYDPGILMEKAASPHPVRIR